MKKTEKKIEDEKEKKLVGTLKKNVKSNKVISKSKASKLNNDKCTDKNCHIHGNLKVRGKIFRGEVIRKFHKRIVIEFKGMTYVRKYERYKKSKTKIHARLPCCMENDINIGDYVKVQECRPLSKIIHFVVIDKINKDKTGEKK